MNFPETPLSAGTIILAVLCAAILYIILMTRHLNRKDK